MKACCILPSLLLAIFFMVAIPLSSIARDKSKSNKSDSKSVSAAKKKHKDQAAVLKGPSVEVSLEILNLWGERPESTQKLYTHAFQFLESDESASFAKLSTSPGFAELCAADTRELLGGPMLGGISSSAVRVWVRTVRPSQVSVRLSVDGEDRIFGPVSSAAATDMTAIVAVTGLAPNARYRYQVLVDGKAIRMPAGSAITTAPTSDSDVRTRILFGSCFHRWGIGNPTQTQMMIDRKPNAALWLGDIAVQDRNNHLGLHRADYLLRDLAPAWQRLTASVPIYATWDDHDYFANDKAGIPKGYTQADKEGEWDVFRNAWNNPSYGLGEDGRGIFLRTRIGACDIIMLDNRYFRKNEPGSFLGDAQMAWLETQLLDCKGPFVVLSCGSMWSDFVSNGKDSWGANDPQGRERIFSLIEKHKIGGVLLISGDRHGARAFSIPRPSGFQFYEFEAASLGQRSGPPTESSKWLSHLFGIDSTYAFGEFTIDPSLPDPEVTFRLVQQDEKVLYSKTLTRSELTP